MAEFVKIDERAFNFALHVIEAYKYLVSKGEYVMSKQFLKSGTSIGANIHEAQAGQTKKDFISKMSIASKEARETEYWLRLLDRSGYIADFDNKDYMLSEISSIINIVTRIIKTSKARMKV